MVVAAAKAADMSDQSDQSDIVCAHNSLPRRRVAEAGACALQHRTVCCVRRMRGLYGRWRQRKQTETNGNNGFVLAALIMLAALSLVITPHYPQKGCKPDRKSALKERKGL